jgi:hypothetical protein
MAESKSQDGDVEEKLLPTSPNDHTGPQSSSQNGHPMAKPRDHNRAAF